MTPASITIGLAGAADVILIPEIPYNVGPIVETVRKRKDTGYPFSVIVVAEGAKSAEGSLSVLGERKAGEMIR